MNGRFHLLEALGATEVDVGWDTKHDQLVVAVFDVGADAPRMAFGLDKETALVLVEKMLAELRRRNEGDG